MALSLQKGGNLSLSKADPSLTKIVTTQSPEKSAMLPV